MTKEQWMEKIIAAAVDEQLNDTQFLDIVSQMWDEAYRQGAEEALNACEFEEDKHCDNWICCWNVYLVKYQERKRTFLDNLK